MKKMVQATKKARCHEFIETHHLIGEDGPSLSGGEEKQRVSAGSVKDAGIIIFDETAKYRPRKWR